ncbi:MAG TPA: MaoC family dehydratase N-terminal domain-containing protein, partial [Acidimicrobiia bacterium]|nr:MaoC family dehydratase N-terminal domain-containing protein [Acidimicrobiia bacterium]
MKIERFPVEATHIMMFARAIGDPNPAFADPDSPEAQAVGGVVAPPTFSMAGSQFDPDNVLRPKPGEPWFGSGREPSGAVREGSGLLHAEQVFEYHQPLRAGMELVATEREGRSWEKESKRGGLLKFSETITDYHDAATGEL